MNDRATQPSSAVIAAAGQNVAADKLVLILNAGSSSLKFALYDYGPALKPILSGDIDRIGTAQASLGLIVPDGPKAAREAISAPTQASGLDHLLTRLAPLTKQASFAAIGHRVVHGGPHYRDPQRVDTSMLAELRRIRSFDPEHLPAEITLMEILAERFPLVPQVACFDTAFHSTMPRVAKLLPIPRRYETLGVFRYGFHGLSYAYLMQTLEELAGPRVAQGRVILAHLGNGASMAAVCDGHSQDTTMAFTPAAGLMMGTRCGDIDPGLVNFLASSEQMTALQFDKMASHASGLLGISETSADMRDLLALQSSDTRASEAIALFCYQVKKTIGAYATVLGGLDTLIFSGGIGENSPQVRQRVCAGLDFLGIDLDPQRNDQTAGVISTDASLATVRVIRTNEEIMIAQAVSRILAEDALDQ